MLNLHEMFIAAIKLAFKNMQNYTLQIYHILTTIQGIFILNSQANIQPTQ